MPIQLDKILIDVAEEKVLCPNYPEPKKKDVDEAWIRVGKKNDLSVHEARSIFKVLQKKYETEKIKEQSGWKLFQIMHDIHKYNSPESTEEEALPMEEDEEYEMLEVQEEEEQQPQQVLYTGNASFAQVHSSGGESPSDGESPSKSLKSGSSHGSSPEHYDKPATKITAVATPREEKKVLNSLVSSNVRNSTLTTQSSTAVALQKKGITIKKATPLINAKPNIGTGNTNTPQAKSLIRNSSQILEVGKTIRMPESIKRKLSEEYSTSPATKKFSSATTIQSKTSLLAKQTVGKRETETDDATATVPSKRETTSPSNGSSNSVNISHPGISLITIPANVTVAQTSASLISNGNHNVSIGNTNNSDVSSPRIEDMDFANDIILEANSSGDLAPPANNGNSQQKNSNGTTEQTEVALNLGNSDNVLPRTFFKNLCTSNRYESLGLYVANAMNRLNAKTAARLELNILRAIIDAQKESLELS